MQASTASPPLLDLWLPVNSIKPGNDLNLSVDDQAPKYITFYDDDDNPIKFGPDTERSYYQRFIQIELDDGSDADNVYDVAMEKRPYDEIMGSLFGACMDSNISKCLDECHAVFLELSRVRIKF